MPLVVDVPLNTMLADLDETLRSLLRRELVRHGFDGVEIAFDAPSREWSSQLTTPTVNLFLYDVRESTEHRQVEWRPERSSNGRPREIRPPMVVECSYAVTAWTQAVEDEHRLLSQVLGVFFAFPELPRSLLGGRLAQSAQRFMIEGRIGQARGEGKADFWNAVGGQYKASLEYVVTLACESGTVYERGPEVRQQTIAVGLEGGPRVVHEMHRVAGTIRGEDGAPAADVWVTLPDAGVWSASDAAGRFVLQRVPPGTHRVLARAPDGAEADAEVSIPGAALDLELAAAPPRGRRRKAG
jgi:hypothetical protein